MWNLTFLFFSCLSVLSCRPDDYPKRQFTPCETLATEIGYSANGLTVSVNLNSLTETLASIEWDFGDGTAKQTSLNSTQTHTYSKAGTYTITVTLTDKCTKTLVKTATVTVTAIPVLTTVLASSITSNSAIAGVRFTSLGNPSVLQYGICYTTNSNVTPTVDNATVKYFSNVPDVNSALTQQLDNLQPNTTYYYRAFAVTAGGKYYPEGEGVLTFKTTPDITSGLVAYLDFDNDTWDNSPSNNNHGEVIPNSSKSFDADRRGKTSSAFRFDGTNYIKIADNASLRSSVASIAFWFKTDNVPNSSNRFMHLLYKADYETDGYKQYSASLDWTTQYGISVKADLRQGSCENAWQPLHKNNYSLTTNWCHVAIVFNGNKGELYINGAKQQDTTFASTGIANCPGGDIILGAQTRAYPNNFKGLMDEFRVYNIALTEEQIKALYNL